jgi:drug/metabolite transporter (DMT)-like permease
VAAGGPAGPRAAAARAGPAVTHSGQALAVGLALAGSASYSIAVVTQQRAAARLPSGRAFDVMVLLQLARRPAWLAGLAAVIGGVALQATALALGKLVVIEPVFASGLLFALVLAAYRDRRRLRPGEWAAALAVVGGLALFLAAGQPAGGLRTAAPGSLGLAAALAAATGLAAVVIGRLAPSRRALLFGIGGGLAAGATDALIKSVTALLGPHLLVLLTDTRLWLLAGMGLLTFTIQQNGYRAAGLAAFLPAFAVVEPVSGSLLGLIAYHERLNDSPGQIAVELIACAVAAWGIARLARSGPAQPDPAGPGLAQPAALAPEAAPAAGGSAVPAGQSAGAAAIAAVTTEEA